MFVIMSLSTFTKESVMVSLFLAAIISSAVAQDVTGTGECWSACEARNITSFVKAKNSTSVNASAEYIGMQLFEEDSTIPFRFASVNAPNLHRLEVSSSNSELIEKPSRAEIWDILCSVQQLGGQVVRGYTLSYGNDSSFHIQAKEPAQIGQHNDEFLPELTFNEEWFEVLDSVLEAAGALGIRVFFPFMNMVELPQWGGAASLSRWSNVSPINFYSSEITKSLYKQVVSFVINRRNTLTGTLYKNDPAILGWELGNELFSPTCEELTVPVCGANRPIRKYPGVPTSWTEEMSNYIRLLDENHLILDGAYPNQDEVAELPNVDVMGATYYEGDEAQLLEDTAFIAGRKAFFIKEFGLSGLSTITTVTTILEAFTNDSSIAGALYWSLRGHADQGGFYWHYEKSVDKDGLIVYPTSLHWPGFSETAPTYENIVFDLLINAGSDVGAPSPPASIPCTPRVELLGGDYFPPCMSLIGSTGASRYELWVTEVDEFKPTEPVPYTEVQESWLRVQRDAHDATAETSAALSFFLDDDIRTLFGWAGDTWRICATACNPQGNCSACTIPMDLTMDVSGGIAPLCLSSFSNHTMADEDADYLGRYLFALPRPDSWWITFGVLLTLALASFLVLVIMCRAWVVTACGKAVGSYKTALFSDFHQSADAVASGSKAPFLWAGEFAVLKAFAIVLLILHCRRADIVEPTWPLSAVVQWGSMSYSFLFLLAGFVLGSEHFKDGGSSNTPSGGTSSLALRCFWKRVAHLGPVLFLSSIIGFFQFPESLSGSYLLLPLGITAWFPSMWENEVNSPAWVVGAMAFCGLVLLPVLDALRESKPSKRTRVWLIVTCWILTLWQANDVLGQRLFLLDRFLVAIFLRAFAPSFVAGVILASFFEHDDREPSTAMPGSSITAAVAMVVMSLIPLDNSFLAAWVRSGAIMPLQVLLIHGVASMDHFAGVLSWFRAPISIDMFTVLLLQQCTWSVLSDLTGDIKTALWVVFCCVLPIFAAVVDFLICRPFSCIFLSFMSKVDATPIAYPARTDTEKLVIYYASLIIIVVTFCVAQFYDPWVSIGDLSDVAWLPGFLEAFSWILLAPAPALLMGLGGLLLYPAVLQPSAKPISQQLADELEESWDAGVSSSDVPFKIHFRIVTRGNNPNLVLGNCETALEVLRSSPLPANRWKLEVVTDKAMGLSSKCEVTEIVVPDDYSPPGGCKFKARALNYAVNASSAEYEDWLVHLDEETRFDANTVTHIFEHCRKQHALVQSGATKFPSIGQGVIYYNKAGIENYLTALADTIRVADDYAKFALQYRMFRLPLIGMHGSFVVCCNSLQRDVGWDWGVTGSITEDTYLAMKLAAMGVRFDFCGGNMYEQSPFSCLDFAKQRARWFSGLWLCVVTKTLPLWQRVFLGSHLASWSLCPLLTFITWINLLTIFPRTESFIFLMSFVFSIPFWSYCLGFVLGFSPSQFKHGAVEWLLLFICHVTLIPVYTMMETYGVARGICDRKTYVGFHVVQKEGNLVKKQTQQRDSEDNAEEDSHGGPDSQRNTDSEVVVEIHSRASDESAALDHWEALFPIDPLDLGYDAPDSSPGMSASAVQLETREIVVTADINKTAQFFSSSPTAVVAASFSAFLRRYVRQEKFVVGVWQPEMKLEAFPLQASISLESSLSCVVADVSRSMVADHLFSSSIDLDKMVQHFGGTSKIFQATIALVSSEETSSESKWCAKQSSITDLAIICSSTAGGALKLRALFNPSRFKMNTIDVLISSFSCFLQAALTDGARPLKLLPIMTKDARRLALKSFNDEMKRESEDHATPPTLQALLARSLQTAAPESVAIEDPQTGKRLSYSELDRCTRHLASVLRNQYNVGLGDVVVVAAERTMGTVISLLGIARSGAAYMPVDSAYPAARIRFMIQDAGVKLLLCSADQAPLWDRIISVDSDSDESFVAPQRHIVAQDLLDEATGTTLDVVDLQAETSPDSCDPAAVLYTSGSTGQPKGVVIPQSAIARQFVAISECTGLRRGDRVAQQTTLTFDVAGNEIFGCIYAQGTLVLVDETSRLLGFESFIARHSVNVLFITPSHLGVMSPSACGPTLRAVAVAGEAVPKALIDKWATTSRAFYNEYGPSETNVVTALSCSAHSKYPASIGHPLAGVQLLILDEFLQPVPVGVPGELCVGGRQVASGYLNRPELSREKFISWFDDEDTAQTEHRLYRTGDLCQWLPDGSVEFLGRIDSQVKIRGMRVEVGEIESTILDHDNVSHCAVLLLGHKLVAFVVLDTSASNPWDAHAMCSDLARKLPEHMIPSAFQLLGDMPMTSSGKINRKALAPLWTPDTQTQVQFISGVVVSESGTAAVDDSTLPPLAISGEKLSMGTFLTSERAMALRKRGVDSLGMMRQYRALVATEAFAKAEERVVNCIRAVCMLGVIIDHLANCAPGSPCTVVAAKVLFPHAGSGASLRNFLLLLETLMRSIGGYKTIAGFSMASGYIDAGGSRPYKLGMMEVAIAIIYLEMTWIWDPFATAVSVASGQPDDNPWWLAQHRWYLLSMLMSRVALVGMHALRIPPLIQVLAASIVMLLSAPNFICISSLCTGNAVAWSDWGSAPEPFNFVLLLLFRGIEPQDASWPYGGFRYVVARKYLLMVFLYILAFHYGRPVIKMAVDGWSALQERWKAALSTWNGKARKALLHLPRAMAGTASFSLLLVSSVWLAGEWGAEEDNWVQEWGADRDEAHLTRLGLVTVVLVFQVLFLAGTFTFIPVGLRTAGTTTLGAFVAHSYCNIIVSKALVNNPDLHIHTPAFDFCTLLLAAFAIQLFVGPLVHWVIIQHLILLAKLAAALYRKLFNRDPRQHGKQVPSPPTTQLNNAIVQPLDSESATGVGSSDSVQSVLILSNMPAEA